MEREKPDQRVIEKIQKLLRFANDGRGNEHEMARAAAQAEAMLRKYNLEHTEVIMEEMKNDTDAVTESTVFLRYRKNKRYSKVPAWSQWIAVRVAELFDCHVAIFAARNEAGQPEASLKFFGYHTDLQICAWMMDFILSEVYRAGTNNPAIQGQKAADSFREGAALTISRRLKELKQARDAEYAASSNGTALVIYKRGLIEQKYGQFGYNHKKRNKSVDANAYYAGVDAGKKVNLTPNPIANTAPPRGSIQ